VSGEGCFLSCFFGGGDTVDREGDGIWGFPRLFILEKNLFLVLSMQMYRHVNFWCSIESKS
jgi:hypothetical protein